MWEVLFTMIRKFSSMVKFPSSGIIDQKLLVDEMSKHLRLDNIVNSVGIIQRMGCIQFPSVVAMIISVIELVVNLPMHYQKNDL